MTANLRARLRRLEAAGSAGAQPNGVLILPLRTAMSDAAVDRLVAEHRERTGWRGTLLILPDNGRGTAPLKTHRVEVDDDAGVTLHPSPSPVPERRIRQG